VAEMQVDDNDPNTTSVLNLEVFMVALIRAYSSKLYKIAFCMVRNHSSAEDILQETFIRVYRHFKQTPRGTIPPTKLNAWLTKITYHQSLNYQRDHKQHTSSLSLDFPETRALIEMTTAGRVPSPEREIEAKETRNELYAYLDQLPSHLRIILLLRCQCELTYPEIAELLEQPINTVKSHGRRGLLRLQQLMGTRSKQMKEKDNYGE
jgi:RNA polymerase sigma-70 factor, ECF subfamily